MKNWISNNINIVITILSSSISAIIGAFVTWAISASSKQGKLRVYIRDWNYKFYHISDDSYGGYVEIEDKNSADSLKYKLSIDIYNDSGSPKVMRDIKIVFLKRNTILFEIEPKNADSALKKMHWTEYKKVNPINIPEKVVLPLNLLGEFKGEKVNTIKSAEKVLLTYKNNKEKKKKIIITNNFK